MLPSTHCDSIEVSIYTPHTDSLFLYGQPLVIHVHTVPLWINIINFYNLALNQLHPSKMMSNTRNTTF